jgi:hypothetical protein
MGSLFLTTRLSICIEVRSWQIYAIMHFFRFMLKFRFVRLFLRIKNCHLPRYNFELTRPELRNIQHIA